MEFFAYLRYLPAFLAIFFLFIFIIKILFNKKIQIYLSHKAYLYIIPLLLIGLLLLTSYILGRATLAEYYFKKSLQSEGFKEVYNYQKLSIITNPYIDYYRIRFSQTNLVIADSLAKKASSTPQDKQTITKAIQAAIEEAKTAVKLDDQKAANWANLGNVYKNLLTTAQNADSWAISSYQRAIVLDPKYPSYRLELGGVYYLLKKYEEAIRLFQETIKLRPDWPNAYYNLAWAYYQIGDVEKAVANMESTISLLKQKKDSASITKAKQDLDLFKNKIASDKKF